MCSFLFSNTPFYVNGECNRYIKQLEDAYNSVIQSIGNGLDHNIRARIKSASKMSSELTKTNTFMKAKRAEADIDLQGFTANAMTQAELTALSKNYLADKAVLDLQETQVAERAEFDPFDFALTTIGGTATGASGGAALPF